MRPRIPTPRLLPLTIVALGALLAVKSVWLVRAWLPAPANRIGMVTAAHAAGHEPQPAAPAAPVKPEPVPDPGPPPVSDSERAILLDLRQRRLSLDRRDATVTARESVLRAAEQKIAARVDEMRALQQRLETLDNARQQREDASWQGLVKLYEAMKPHDAATIFNELAMSVLLPLVSHMKEAKAAPILAAMTPDKARELTSQLAKSRTRLEPPPESKPQSPPLKGH